MDYRTQLGNQAEETVAQQLQREGFTILERNYRKQDGEIDLIARKDSLIVFVEVKMRQQNYFDLGHVITPSKQRKIILVAKKYLSTVGWHEYVYRFDVALLYKKDNILSIDYIPNAFNQSCVTW